MDKATKKKIKALLQTQSFEELLTLCQDIVGGGNGTEEVHTYLGFCRFKLGDLQAAVEAYETALQLNAQHSHALKGLGQCLLGNVDVSHQKKARVYPLLFAAFPSLKDKDTYTAELVVCLWKLGRYQESFDYLDGALQSARASVAGVVQFLFADVAQTDSLVCFELLRRLLTHSPTIELDIDKEFKFYYEYAAHLNRTGSDPVEMSRHLQRLVEQHVQIPAKRDSSTGSDEVGFRVEPGSGSGSVGCWAAKTLQTQMWCVWSELGDWNGAPHLQLPGDVLAQLENNCYRMGKELGYWKSVVDVLSLLEVGKCKDAVLVCADISSTYQTHTPDLLFLAVVARATCYIGTDKLDSLLRKSERMMLEEPTYHNASLYKVVTRFRCYLSYTFNIPLPLNVIAASADPVVEMWRCYLSEKSEALSDTCPTDALSESGQGHTMLELLRILRSLEETDSNVEERESLADRISDKVCAVREEYPRNYFYNSLVVRILEKLVRVERFDKNKYHVILQECSAIDPRNLHILQHMGDYYRSEGKSPEAAKCYERSMRLSPSMETLEQLEGLLEAPGEGARTPDTAVRRRLVQSYQHMIKVTPDYKLYVRLALLTESDKTCVEYLQKAAELEKQDAAIYELLGEKYLKLGKYKSGFKAYKCANTLEYTSYRTYCIANILVGLGKLDEALLLFQSILQKEGSYSPALAGSVRCLGGLVARCVETGRYLHALHLAQQAMLHADKLLLYESAWSSSWKQIGDMCVKVVRVRDAALSAPPNLTKLLALSETQVSGHALILLAIRCYQRGLSVNGHVTEYLVDISRAYLLLATHQDLYLRHALTFAKRAVSVRPKDHLAWNLLGCVCVRDKSYKLAQHAYIRSLHLNSTQNSESWSNLGLLYLLNKQHHLANRCFTEAQSNHPKYAPSWVGQAFVAKRMVGYEAESTKLFKDIARDVTRHMTIEGTLGHALHYCNTQLQSTAQDDLHDTLTIVNRCTYMSDSTWIVYNLCGILYEHVKLHQSALHNYIRAQTLAPSQQIRSGVQSNVERVQCKRGSYTSLPPHGSSIHCALALMRLGKYGQASTILDSMTGREVSVFQACLAWWSRDRKLAASFLSNPDTDLTQLLSWLMLELAPSDMCSFTIAHKPPDIQTKYTCLMLARQRDREHPGVLEAGKLPRNPGSVYLTVKYLVVFGKDPELALSLIRQLKNSCFMKEDILELELEVLLQLQHEEDPQSRDTSSLSRDTSSVSRDISLLSQRALHMFPWRTRPRKLLVEFAH